VQLALTRDYLPSSTFTVKTIPNGNTVEIYVYLNSQLIATQTVSL
jgi:ribosomal protein L19